MGKLVMRLQELGTSKEACYLITHDMRRFYSFGNLEDTKIRKRRDVSKRTRGFYYLLRSLTKPDIYDCSL